MNQVIETLMNRRSVRFYEPRPIDRKILETIIAAGNAAPSGANAQRWRFVVVEDPAFRRKLVTLAIPRYKIWMGQAPKELAEMRKEIDAVAEDPIYYGASAVVFVIGSGMTRDLDSPMVCENMMIAARSLGIGSCWVFFGQLPLPDPEVRAALEIRTDEKVYGPVLLGYPKDGVFPDGPAKKPPVVKWI